jgi:hypothetical protein
MSYVEWLRVRGVLKWTAMVLVVLVALLLVMRISLLAVGPHDALSFVHSVEVDQNSRVTHAALPDGTSRTVIDNAKQGVHVVVDDRGYGGKHIEIFESSQHASARAHESVSMGDIHVDTIPGRNVTVTTIDTSQPEDLAYYFAIASFVALIVGTILGAPFARENDGHLEIALTKPAGRERLAFGIIVADLAGIGAAWVMTIVFLMVAHTVFEAPHFEIGPNDGILIALGLAGNLAWYAMLCAATASMRRAYGAVLGFAWPVAAVVAVLGKVNLSSSQLGQVVHTIVTPFAWIDPFTYLHFGPAFTVNDKPAGSMAVSPGLELPILLILALVYGALAVFQWRRVEA